MAWTTAGSRSGMGGYELHDQLSEQFFRPAGGYFANFSSSVGCISEEIYSRQVLYSSYTSTRDSILAVYGVLPGLFNPSTTGPMVREAQRHLAQWQLQPVANLLAAEASQKLEQSVSIDVMQPLQAFDASGRARAANAVVQLLTQAKEAGIDPDQALKLVNWAE
jgi:hypothetical protein